MGSSSIILQLHVFSFWPYSMGVLPIVHQLIEWREPSLAFASKNQAMLDWVPGLVFQPV